MNDRREPRFDASPPFTALPFGERPGVPGDWKAALPIEVYVEQRCVERFRPGESKAVLEARRRPDHNAAFIAQRIADHLGEQEYVFDHQDARAPEFVRLWHRPFLRAVWIARDPRPRFQRCVGAVRCD